MEYGLILGLLASVILAGIGYFYQELANLFSEWGGWFAAKNIVSGS
jgi:Flp pilus assembly pilin Flp